MKLIIIFLFCLLYSVNTFASVNCSGTPSTVWAGAHGPAPAEHSFWVSFKEGGNYYIGRVTDDLAKARFSMLQTALVAEKTVLLRFYHHSTCLEASQEKAVPTSASFSN